LLIKQQVIELKDKGKRTCNKNKRHIAANKCYKVATIVGNNNMLFVILEIKPREDKQWHEQLETLVIDRVEFKCKEIKLEEQAHLDLYSVPSISIEEVKVDNSS
jgi:hypothetical protein